MKNGRKKQSKETHCKKLQARKIMQLTEQPPIKQMIPELAQLVLERVEVRSVSELGLYFVNGICVEMNL